MEDSFYIGAYWGPRAETLVEVASKTLQTLQNLKEVDEHFSKWYELGMSRKQALEKKVVLEAEIINGLYRKTVKREELDEKEFTKIGFIFSLWTGHKDDESSNISFNVGTANKRLTNCCVLKIPYEGVAKDRLLQNEKAKLIISILVEVWNPDYAVLTSYKLGDRINDANEIGWITYRKSIRRVPKGSNKIIYEKLNNGHLFTISSSSKYDIDDSVNELLQMKSNI